MSQPNQRSYYEFFAGGGMARVGLGKDWRCVFANDISPMKGQTYAANFGDADLRVADIHTLNSADLPGHVDLAWGSFPCQDLSLAGIGAGLAGERSGAFWGYWSLIRALNREGRKPRIVVLENVYGALTSRGGDDFQTLISAIVAEGYLVGAIVIDAILFVPQSRPRVFIVGVDSKLDLPLQVFSERPNPVWHPDGVVRAFNKLPAEQKVEWRWFTPGAPMRRMETLDDLIEAEPEGVTWHSPEETSKLLDMMTPLNRHKVIQAQAGGRRKVGTIYRRTRLGVQRAEVRFDGVAGCLRTPSGGSSRQTILVVEGSRIRSRLLSPRELMRLMGLPDTYVVPSRYNDAYHVAGDGVVAPVVSHIRYSLLDPVISGTGRSSLEPEAA